MTFGSLDEAIAWAKPRWGDALIPYRLVERALGDDGAPHMHPAMLRFLDAKPGDLRVMDYQEPCFHPRTDGRNCPDCDNTGLVDKHGERYLYPMAAALYRLHVIAPRRPFHPSLAVAVVALAENNWDLGSTSSRLDFHSDVVEAWCLMGLRKLHVMYRERPYTTLGWVSKSESQRSAEGAVA